jgi:agmatinase
MNRIFNKGGSFIGSITDYDLSDVVILGVPMDYTVSFRPGARSGPEKIRQVSEVLEEYSPYADKNLNEINYYDLGDLELPFGNVQGSLKLIEKAVNKFNHDKKHPLILGGEHLITLPVIKSLASNHRDLKVIQFDAHADLREEYLGEKNSHAAVMKKICDIIGPENVYQIGIRSGTKEEFEYGKENTNFYPFNINKDIINKIVKDCMGCPVYLTIDIDVLDPAYAPGTGTPEPGGCTSKELFCAVGNLKGINLIGCDIVEVAPIYDMSDITAITAAKLVREILLGFY